MRRLFFISASFFVFNVTYSQTCEVLLASIQGKYVGDCKKEKADGKGKSEGTDTYEGFFKGGYPSGEGMYTYKNGDFYTGEFKKGVKEGKGEFHYKKADAADSIVKGFWKNDGFVGEYLHPFEIESKTSGFARLDIKPDVGQPNMITFVAQNTIRSNSLLGNIPPPRPEIQSFEVNEGSYEREEKLTTDKTTTLILYNVKFPIHINIKYDGESYMLLISKPGTWRVFGEISQRE